MKLNSGGLKDEYDVVGLYELLIEEKEKTNNIARIIRSLNVS